jgi:hypothetical protein
MVGSSWSTLLLSKIDSDCAASLEAFSKQRTLRWFWNGPVFRDGHALRYSIRTIVTFGEWDVCDVRTEFW